MGTPETLTGKIDTLGDLNDFIDTEAVLKDAREKGIDFDTAIRAQMEGAGVDAEDAVVAELVVELEQKSLVEA